MRNNRELSQFASYIDITDTLRTIGVKTDLSANYGVAVGGTTGDYNSRVDGGLDPQGSLIVFSQARFLNGVDMDGGLTINGAVSFANTSGVGIDSEGNGNFNDLYVSGISTFASTGAVEIESPTTFGRQYIGNIQTTNNYVTFYSNADFAGYVTFTATPPPKFTHGLYVEDGISNFDDRIIISNTSESVERGRLPFGLASTNFMLEVDGSVTFSDSLVVGAALSVSEYITIGYTGSLGVSEFLSTCTFSSDVNIGFDTSTELRIPSVIVTDLTPSGNINVGNQTSRWNFGYFNIIDSASGGDFSGNVNFFQGIKVSNQPIDSVDGMNITGISTVADLFVNGQQTNIGDAYFVGVVTVTSPVIDGVARTALQANNVDIKAADLDDFYYFPLLNGPGIQTAGGGELFVNNGLYYNPISSSLFVGQDLSVLGNNINANPEFSDTRFNLLNSNVLYLDAFGDAQQIYMGNPNPSGVATFTNYQFHVERLQVNANQIQASTGNTNITLVDDVNTIFAGDIQFEGDTIKTSSTTAFIFDETVQFANMFGDALYVDIGSQGIGIASIRNNETHLYGDLLLKNDQILASDGATAIVLNSNETVTVFGDLVVGGNDIRAGGGQTNITMLNDQFTIFAGDIQVNGNEIYASDGSVNILMESNTLTSVTGALRVEGNTIQAGTGATNITLIDGSRTVIEGDIQVKGNSIRASNGLVNIEMEDNTKTIIQGDLQVNGDDIRGADGTICITLEAPSGNVAIGSDLYANSVFFNGIDAVLNNENIKIKDNLIDIGLLEDPNNLGTLIGPNTTTNYDAGLLLNYYSVGLDTSKKASIFWDNSRERIAIASSVREVDANIVTVDNYAALETENIYINSVSGLRQLFEDDGTNLQLKRVVIDAGTY